MKVLDATQTEGSVFQVRGGQYQAVVEYGSATVKLQVHVPGSDPARVDRYQRGMDRRWRQGVLAVK